MESKILPKQFFTMPNGTGEDEPTIKLPPGFWRLNYFRAEISTDATVANRAACLTFQRPGTAKVCFGVSGDVPSGLEVQVTIAPELPRATAGSLAVHITGPVANVIIPGESTVALKISSGQSGDVVTSTEMEFERVA